MEKRLFIASTANQLAIAQKIESFLSPEYRCKLWIAETFEPGASALESLLSEVRNTDFALILLTADDRTVLNADLNENATVEVPRDNLIFEAGLFLSALGRQRVALCVENPPKVKLPTDLSGQNMIEFSIDQNINSLNFQHVISGLANTVKRQFSLSDSKTFSAPTRIGEPALAFGDSRHTDIVVDSAFQPSDRRGLKKEIERAIAARRVLPTKLFYATEEGANCWLELTRDPGYQFFRTSISILRRDIRSIIEAVEKKMPGVGPDLISLGSGDGEKDAIVISELCKRLGSHAIEGKISYYPLDYSFYLITETVKTVSGYVKPHEYRIKPIVGDMMDLSSFRYVYENYPNPNIFVIMGNTVGNNDEVPILQSLRASLLPGDIALIEVNTDKESIKRQHATDFVVSKKSLQHDFSPLSLLGFDYAEENFIWRTRNNLSACPNTVSIETLYRSEPNKEIPLSINHRYDFKSFRDWVSGMLGCEVIWEGEDRNVGLILLFRPN
jgi:hypothetical protein